MRYKSLMLILVTLLVAGCHARFKKFAKKANSVDVKVDVTSSPRVNLTSGGNAEGVVGLAADTAAAASSIETQKRLEKLMRPEQVEQMVQRGTVDNIGDGPPFSAKDAGKDGTIAVAVTSYGIYRSGGSPVFSVDFQVRGYDKKTNETIYKNSVSCRDSNWIDVQGPGQAVGTAAAISQLQQMSDKELRIKLENVVRRCTASLVSEMRKHAG